MGLRLAPVELRPGRRPRPAGRPVASGGWPAWSPAWAGWEAGGLGRVAGLEAGLAVFASFFFSLSILWGLLLVTFSIILDLFSTPLWVIIRLDPEYTQGTGMK